LPFFLPFRVLENIANLASQIGYWPMKPFETLAVYHDRTPRLGAMNMAIDEALLENANLPTVRFYSWARPSLSFGYFGRIAEAEAAEPGREVVRRWTGGGIVLHGDDLTYTVIVPATDPLFRRDLNGTYSVLHQAICRVLCASGREATLAADAAPKISEACFANPVRADILLGGRKIAGAAQRRTRWGFLHQGSVQLDDLPANFAAACAAAFSPCIYEKEIAPEIQDRARMIAANKYATTEWLRRW
jgi:lipoate-protein ligase A